MADRAKKISELDNAPVVAGSDLLVVVTNPSSNAATRKVTVNTFFNVSNSVVVSANTLVVRNFQSPANSTIAVTQGTIFYDANYLYIAVANNMLKRVALSSF